MKLIPDDPIIASIERTGYPHWIDADYEEIGEEAGDDPGGKESE